MSGLPRVLVIEDDPQVSRIIGRMLSHYELCMVTTIAAARAAKDFDPDVVVLDFYLPDGTARDLEGELDCPVLLTSSDVDVNTWEDWGAFFADDFCHKPFAPSVLRKKVDRLVDQRRLQREVTRSTDELRRIHIELVEHRDADDAEAEAARDLLDRMVQRSKFDPKHVSVELLTARRFGGDVVLADELTDGRYRWLVGDVTGHTLASALVTIPISMVFHTTCRRAIPIAHVVETLHEQLSAILPPSMFFAAIICELDRSTGTLSVYNAGAPDVIVQRASGELVRIASHAPPLAAVRDRELPLETRRIHVEPCDAIYAFSDGLVEISDGTAMFGIERVIATIAAANGSAFEQLGRSWRAHLGDGTRDDDLALIEVRV